MNKNKNTIINFKRIMSALLSVIMICGALSLTSCSKEEPIVIKESETCIIIKTNAEAPDVSLIDYMASLKEKGDLEFEVQNSMVTSINGIENPADYSKCWMLYTSDSENANAAWGTVEYDETVYGSAIVGAEALKIKPNNLYIWVFKSFN